MVTWRNLGTLNCLALLILLGASARLEALDTISANSGEASCNNEKNEINESSTCKKENVNTQEDILPLVATSCVQFSKPKSSPSVIYAVSEGRLGNQLVTYSLMLGLRKQFGYETFISKEGYDFISQVFSSESIEVSERWTCIRL